MTILVTTTITITTTYESKLWGFDSQVDEILAGAQACGDQVRRCADDPGVYEMSWLLLLGEPISLIRRLR
jgi:hypothetical protein